jgi:hypothetical protein
MSPFWVRFFLKIIAFGLCIMIAFFLMPPWSEDYEIPGNIPHVLEQLWVDINDGNAEAIEAYRRHIRQSKTVFWFDPISWRLWQEEFPTTPFPRYINREEHWVAPFQMIWLFFWSMAGFAFFPKHLPSRGKLPSF